MIGRGLRVGDGQIDRQDRLHQLLRHAHMADLRAARLQAREQRIEVLLHPLIADGFLHIVEHADHFAADIAVEQRAVCFHRTHGARHVAVIAACEHFQHRAGILHIRGEIPDMIQAGGIRDDAIAADAAVSRLHADDAVVCRRLAHAVSGIRTDGDCHGAGCHAHGAAAA